MRREFQRWYPQQVCGQLQASREVTIVDLRLSVVKPLGAQWFIRLFDYFKDIICNGFQFIKNYLEK